MKACLFDFGIFFPPKDILHLHTYKRKTNKKKMAEAVFFSKNISS